MAPSDPPAGNTADPKGAREHARAMGHIRVDAMPTVPAARAAELPPGVPPDAMLWEETIPGGGYAAKELHRGARLRLVDLHGDACASMLVFNAERPVERLNIADTVKVQWNAYLGAGSLLLSDMGRVLLSILEDSAGTHDTFCGASTARSNAARYGSGDNYGPHPNARDRFMLATAKFGLGRRDIHPCVNWFKGNRIGPDGGMTLEMGPFPPGRTVTLRAEMNVIVVLANCPHPRDPRPGFCVSALRASAWRGPPAPAGDLVRNATPEAQRAFLNVDEYFQR
jgi:urea carboxylase-associated protein 2